MAAQDRPEIDHFEIVRQFAKLNALAPSDFARIDALALTLVGRGVTKDDLRIKDWMGASICHNQEQLYAFQTYFDSQSGGREPIQPIPIPRPRPNIKMSATSIKWRDKQWLIENSRKLAGALVLTIAVSVFCWYFWSDIFNYPDFVEQQEDPEPPREVPDIITLPPGEQNNTPDPEFQPLSLLYLLIPIASVASYFWWFERRRRQLKRDIGPRSDNAVSISMVTNTENFFSDPLSRRAIRRIGLHRTVPNQNLNVGKSIAATITSGGIPSLEYGEEPRSPGYVFLAERESAVDHLSIVGRCLSERLNEEAVSVDYYEFFAKPNRAQRIEKGQAEGVASLTEILTTHAGSNVLVMVESHDCFDASRNPVWLEQLLNTPSPALLNPRSKASWGDQELRIAQEGMFPFAIDTQGLSNYAFHLQNADEAAVQTTFAKDDFDLPESLSHERSLILGHKDPGPMVKGALSAQLQNWFSPDSLFWLRALALFPYIHPALTMHLGKSLRDRNGSPILTEERFIRLARLPWLRAGYMPDWLRLELVRNLGETDERNQLSEARAAILHFLQETELKDGDGQLNINPSGQKRISDWLQHSPESRLHDQILMDLMKGKKPDELGVEAPKKLGKHSDVRSSQRERLTAIFLASVLATLSLAQLLQNFGGLQEIIFGVEEEPKEIGDAPENAVDVTEAYAEAAAKDVAAKELAKNAAERAAKAATKADVVASADAAASAVEEGGPQPLLPPPPPPPPPPVIVECTVGGPYIIYFDWDKSDLNPLAAATLDLVVASYGKCGAPRILLAGHTDTSYSASYAVGLSQRMNDSVRSYLEARGIAGGAISTEAFGESQPLVPTADGVREAGNRRVVVTFE